MTQHKPFRRRLPQERAAIVRKFDIAGHSGYLTVGMFPDGSPGEVFIVMSKEGSTISGLMHLIAILLSLCLQYNVPIGVLIEKMRNMRFDPSGVTSDEKQRSCTSFPDYLAGWLQRKFVDGDERPIAERDAEPVGFEEEEQEESRVERKRDRLQDERKHPVPVESDGQPRFALRGSKG